ncbi:MAG TPA: RnfABCDGE type electron transport complex subunit D [Candidatus Blautia avicola]|uniref:RnfABCDGE type electron transport complex subunit D n=1 Tax=Candidatus Blautia avicola TaxID=2838483 RepID=A0A9D2QTP2_9FIRM|nr:RnfABCDGE type electron transport complex subunit D [Candidatus Blautia avicola]
MSQTKAISGPYLRTEQTTRNIMLHVSISLIPALLGAVYYFGIKAFYLTAFSVALCVLTEFVWQKVTKKQVTAGDFSAVVTGMLLAFNMPVTVPLWVLAAADIFSILVVKQMFGGIGSNFANPALMGRLLVMVVWPGTVMQYTAPRTLAADAVSQATILGTVKAGGEAGYSYLQMFLGEVPGAMGETSKLLLLVGFAYMCYMGVVNIEAALTYIATVTVLTFIFGPSGLFTGDILANLFGGGLIMGGCYMLTDYVFVSRRGKLLYALAAGIITAAIRIFSAYPEGICFGILTANCLAGVLTLLYRQHIYGTKKNVI